MSKFLLFLAFICVCLLQAQAQDAANRKTCEDLYRRCLSNLRETGREDDVTNFFNANCLRENRTWQKITRCQLERAACRLTLVKCGSLSCRNVAIAMQQS